VVVNGEDGLDEVTLAGATLVTCVEGDRCSELSWRPPDFRVSQTDVGALQASSPEHSAAMIRDVLAGASGPPRDIVVMNAAAALWAADPGCGLADCSQQAQDAIESGQASKLLNDLVEASHS
jgi:anthranilate phosphoribosyltransferase